jgi:uncharacterized protein (UPF0548 family)
MPILVSRPSEQDFGAFLATLSGMSVTYVEVGATREISLPGGYRHDRYSVFLGRGDYCFHRGCEALRSWQAHRYARATLIPAQPPLVPGTNMVVSIRSWPVIAVAPCQIVYASDEEDCFGFAYGTLPGHPEQGEEAFHVRRAAGGEVTFDIVAFSRPADVLARLGHPVARMVQARVTKAYLEGVRRFVAGDP